MARAVDAGPTRAVEISSSPSYRRYERGNDHALVATSVDGYIAMPDGGVSWLEAFESSDRVAERYDEFFADVDALVMGSHTYEQVLSFGEWPYGEKPTSVITSGELPLASERVELVDGEIDEVAADL